MENNMYIEYNSNPENKLVGDCVVRAISKVTDQDWEKTYMEVCVQGFMMHDMPSSNSVWGGYLFTKGFRRYIIPDTYPFFIWLVGLVWSKSMHCLCIGRGFKSHTGRSTPTGV